MIHKSAGIVFKMRHEMHQHEFLPHCQADKYKKVLGRWLSMPIARSLLSWTGGALKSRASSGSKYSLTIRLTCFAKLHKRNLRLGSNEELGELSR